MKKCTDIIKVVIMIIVLPFNLLGQTDSILVKGILKAPKDEPIVNVVISFIDYSGKQHSYVAKPEVDRFEIKVPKQELVVDATVRAIGTDRTKIMQQRPLNIFIQHSNIFIKGTSDELQLAFVKGGEENNLYNKLRKSYRRSTQEMAYIYADLLKNPNQTDSPVWTERNKRMVKLRDQERIAQKEFIAKNPKSFVSLFLLHRMKNLYTSDDYAQAFSDLQLPDFEGTKKYLEIKAIVANDLVTAKGMQAINFERTTADGKPFTLNDLRGRVFLLDFWGSWCAPCKASMPHLKELREKYKEKGFEIVGVAQEFGKTEVISKTTWLKSIDELGIHWINVLNNENSAKLDIVKSYNVTGFPTKILIDAEGKVILRVVASATDDIDIALKKIYGY